MKLRRVEINGFKSFGKKTVLEFPEGISAIVGPNGSGKSNVIDAICFALGYPSRNLRAAKAQELIHSGKAGNVPEAKVMLTFQKSNETFEIKRKVDRKGRSVYKLNSITTSLDDLHDTLSKHAIPRDGYNIVMQNDVMKFIEIKPIERRRVLDEISGIAGYEDKKKKALEELAIVERRISDTNLILSEKKGYLEQIGKDREVAMKYQGMQDELKRGKSIYLYSALYGLENEIGEAEGKIDKLAKEKELKINELARIDEEVDGIEKNLDKITHQIVNTSAGESGKLKGEMGGLKSAIERKQEEIQFLKGEITVLEGKKKDNAERQKQLKVQIKAKEEELKKQKAEVEKVGKSVSAKEKEREEKAKEYDSSELIALDKERKALSESLMDSKRSITLLEKEIDIIKNREVEISGDINSKKVMQKSLEGDLVGIEESISKLGVEAERVDKLAKDLEGIKAKLSDLFQEFARKESEIKTIERMEQRIGESESLRFVVANRDKGYVGQVSELGTAPDKYRIALEVAAGNKSKSLVVSDDSAAQFYIEGLRKGKVGRATFLPLNKLRGPQLNPIKGEGILGFAKDLIKCDKKYQNLFDFVFGETLVVDSIDTARRIGIGKMRMATLEGDLMESGGAMTGGYYQKAAVTFSSTAENKKRLDDIKSEIAKLGDEKSKLEKMLEGKERINIGVLKEKKNNIIEKIGIVKRETSELSKELSNIDPQKRDMAVKKAGSEKSVEKLEKELAGIEEKMNAKAFSEMRSIMQTIDTQLHELKDTKFEMQGRENSTRSEIESMNSKIKEIDRQTDEVDEQVSKFKNKIQESINNITESGQKLKELEQKHMLATNESQKLFQEQERLSQFMKELGEKKGVIEAAIDKLRTESNDIEIKKAKIEAKLEEVRANMEGVEPPKKEELAGLSQNAINNLRRRVKELEEELTAIGGVNLRAVGMYDELEKQFKEISEKNQKLYEEKEKIYDLIETIEERKKSVFYDSFYKVREQFSQIISELYPSTEGSLNIENEADPFNSGLIVEVKPRGREGMNIDSLSGGEKTLTALAFLMATQSVTPSPFYILDEVDASLDQENVLRLVQFLKNRKQSQFILISHNSETIKHMDSVIGVHMQNGISQIIGVNMQMVEA